MNHAGIFIRENACMRADREAVREGRRCLSLMQMKDRDTAAWGGHPDCRAPRWAMHGTWGPGAKCTMRGDPIPQVQYLCPDKEQPRGRTSGQTWGQRSEIGAGTTPTMLLWGTL